MFKLQNSTPEMQLWVDNHLSFSFEKNVSMIYQKVKVGLKILKKHNIVN